MHSGGVKVQGYQPRDGWWYLFSIFGFLKSHKYRVLNLGGGVPFFTFFAIFNKYWVLWGIKISHFLHNFRRFIDIFTCFGPVWTTWIKIIDLFMGLIIIG